MGDNGQQPELPLDWEGLVNEGIEARKMGDAANWRLGDLAAQVETHYGERDLQRYADAIGANYSTLLDYRRVANRFCERSQNLAWGHHFVVAARKDAEDVLTRAEREGWSVAQLRQWCRKNPEGHEDGLYRTIIIDPPWPMERIQREVRPNQGAVHDYATPTLTLTEIGDWDIREYAVESGCHIYLWTTHHFLPAALDIFGRWGVNYECLITWVKNVGITPFSFMYTTEFVLFGRIGNLPLMKLGERVDLHAPVREHSRKPDEFYDLVRLVSPEPRLDVFSREARPGFDQLGDEVQRFADVSAR